MWEFHTNTNSKNAAVLSMIRDKYQRYDNYCLNKLSEYFYLCRFSAVSFVIYVHSIDILVALVTFFFSCFVPGRSYLLSYELLFAVFFFLSIFSESNWRWHLCLTLFRTDSIQFCPLCSVTVSLKFASLMNQMFAITLNLHQMFPHHYEYIFRSFSLCMCLFSTKLWKLIRSQTKRNIFVSYFNDTQSDTSLKAAEKKNWCSQTSTLKCYLLFCVSNR